jgi:hypothetical protein
MSAYNFVTFHSSDFGSDHIFILSRDRFYPDTTANNLFAVEYVASGGEKIERIEGLTLEDAWSKAQEWISTELFDVA